MPTCFDQLQSHLQPLILRVAMLKYFLYGIVAIIFYYVYTFVVLEVKQRKFKARFAPKGWAPFFGLGFVYLMEKQNRLFRQYETLNERFQKHGHTHGAWILGFYALLTIDPENIKAVLATQFNDFGKGQRFIERWEEFLGRGIFNADGQIWSHARALMRPQFLKERVADLDNFEDKIQLAFNLIQPGKVVDIMDIWFRFTLDSATEHLFGSCANALTASEEENAFAKVFARVQELQIHRDRHGALRWMYPDQNREMTAVIKELNAYVDKYVQLALQNDGNEKDESLLAALVRESRDPVFLRDSLVSTLLAGRDTTAATLSWLMKELSKDPILYDELRNEVLDVLGPHDVPTYSQIKNLKLLQAAINETLRLYPIVPFNIRASLTDTTLPRGGGPDGKSPIFVPAGTTIVYSPLIMQRTVPDIPDRLSWKPHRWLDAKTGHQKKYTPEPWTYIPFNGGPRICLGQNFALTEIAYAMTRLLQRYTGLENFDSAPAANDLGMKYDIILTPRYGVKVNFLQ